MSTFKIEIPEGIKKAKKILCIFILFRLSFNRGKCFDNLASFTLLWQWRLRTCLTSTSELTGDYHNERFLDQRGIVVWMGCL